MKNIKYLLFILITNFILVLCQIFIPSIRDVKYADKLFIIPLATFSVLGFILVYMTKKYQVQGILRKYLYLTGYSAGFVFIGVIIHNLISGIGFLLFDKEIEEPVFFLLSTIVLPILFIIGTVKSLLMLPKSN